MLFIFVPQIMAEGEAGATETDDWGHPKLEAQ